MSERTSNLVALARGIIAHAPILTGNGGSWPADVLALCLALDGMGPVTVGNVATLLGVKQASASELVDRAAGRGLVGRRRSVNDGRVVFVELTAAAVQQMRRARAHRADDVDGRDDRPVPLRVSATIGLLQPLSQHVEPPAEEIAEALGGRLTFGGDLVFDDNGDDG